LRCWIFPKEPLPFDCLDADVVNELRHLHNANKLWEISENRYMTSIAMLIRDRKLLWHRALQSALDQLKIGIIEKISIHFTSPKYSYIHNNSSYRSSGKPLCAFFHAISKNRKETEDYLEPLTYTCTIVGASLQLFRRLEDIGAAPEASIHLESN
jgi:hypothetical protein